MPNELQDYLATSAERAAADLKVALLRLPEDKWNWNPQGDARTALDLVAECAILNESTANTIQGRAFPPDFGMAEYERTKAGLCEDWNALQSLLEQNTSKLIEVIRAVPDEELDVEVQMPWGPMTLTQLISYPYWNMSYHEGQINYIASMLGCLK